jgi:hypothetical protein
VLFDGGSTWARGIALCGFSRVRMRGPSPPHCDTRRTMNSFTRSGDSGPGTPLPEHRRFHVHEGALAAGGGAGAVGLSSGAGVVILAGVLSRMTVTVPGRRAERPGVMRVTRSGTVVGDLTGAAPQGLWGRDETAPRGPAKRYRVPRMGSERGDFHDQAKVPARQGFMPSGGPSCVHSVFRTLRGVIFVNLWRAKRHFTLPYGR